MSDYIHALSGVLCNNSIWFSAIERNGLYKYDLNTKDVIYVSLFPNEMVNERIIHKKCLLVGEQIYFFPHNGKHIHLYSIKDNSFYSIRFEEIVYDVLLDGSDILMICGEKCEKLYILNICSQIISCVKEYENNIRKYSGIRGVRFSLSNNKIWFGCIGTNYIANWDIIERKMERFKTNVGNIFAAFFEGDDTWIIDRDSPNLYYGKCSDSMNRVTPTNISVSADKNALLVPARFYNNIAFFNDKVILLPAYADSIQIYDGKKFTRIPVLSGIGMDNDPKCYGVVVEDDRLYTIPYGNHQMLEIGDDCSYMKIEWIKPYLNRYSLEDRKRIIKESCLEKRVISESEELTLGDFLNTIVM